MRTCIKWRVAIIICLSVGLMVVISYLPKDSTKGASICKEIDGKVITYFTHKGNKLSIFNDGDLAIIDVRGKYLCGSDDSGKDVACYDLATDKRVL